MNKIYISADVEGLNGISSFKQVLPEFTFDYAQMQPQLHKELNALISGLHEAGIENIVVNDAHNTMTNITLSELSENAQLITGKPKDVSMMYGLDDTFDGVIFFAYHAKATSNGVLAHTFNMHFKSVWLNNKKISEAMLNGIYAAKVGVPIILASGDDVFCSEINDDLPELFTIVTKKSICNTAAICRKNSELLNDYFKFGKVINTLPMCSYKTSDNYELKVEFETKILADQIAMATSLFTERNFIVYKSENYTDIYTTLQKISKATTLRKSQSQQV